MRIDNRVREERMRQNLSQEELAERVGVTRQTIIAIERGNYTPSVLLALNLAKTLKRPVETLFTVVH